MPSTPAETNRSDAASEARESTSRPIDIQHLQRYTLGDQALEKEILELFLAQLPETLAALRTALTERDWKTAAHTLKGSSRAVGASRMACLAQDAERLSNSDRDACGDAVSRLETAAAEARAFIEAVYR